MKKFITIALVVVMALSLAAPALAYTNNLAPAQGVSPYTVDVYLVEHNNGDLLTNYISMPPTDRGYAKNEIIAAVGALTVPGSHNVWADGYRAIRFKGKNVALNVTDNNPQASSLNTAARYYLVNTFPSAFQQTSPSNATSWDINDDFNRLQTPIVNPAGNATSNKIPVVSSEKTYKALCFGKVTDDDATMKFELTRNAQFTAFTTAGQANAIRWFGANAAAATTTGPAGMLILNEDYLVAAQYVSGAESGNIFWIYENTTAGLDFDINAGTPGKLVFHIETGSKNKTERLYMYPNGSSGVWYRIHVEPSTQELVFVIVGNPDGGKKINDQVRYGTAGYDSLRSFYDNNFEKKLGFTAYNEGNVMKRGDWHDLAAAAIDVSETVSVEPWTPYVSVPDNMVVNPPKTGDVASIIGFALIALAGAAAIVVKKVRA